MKPVLATSIIAIVALVAVGGIYAHQAMALKNFFNCITDAANKVGGDHNLSKQQVDDCFDKEFPSNPGSNGR